MFIHNASKTEFIRRDFFETKYVFLIKDKKIIMKFGIKSAIASKRDLIVNLYKMKNI